MPAFKAYLNTNLLPIAYNQSFCLPLLKPLIFKPETLMQRVMKARKKYPRNGLNLYQWEWLRHIAATGGKVQPSEKEMQQKLIQNNWY